MADSDDVDMTWAEALPLGEEPDKAERVSRQAGPAPGLVYGWVGSGAFTVVVDASSETQKVVQVAGEVVWRSDFKDAHGVTFGSGMSRGREENGKLTFG